MARPATVIPDEIVSPYPIVENSPIISGFGRGSSELGIPTVNLPMNEALNGLETGIYYGWCKVVADNDAKQRTEVRNDGRTILFNNGAALNATKGDTSVLPMVMSIGWNPFYQNKEKTAEIHIIHKFDDNFYGASIKYNVLGYIRPELDYTTKEALIEDINLDIKIALQALQKQAYKHRQVDI